MPPEVGHDAETLENFHLQTQITPRAQDAFASSFKLVRWQWEGLGRVISFDSVLTLLSGELKVHITALLDLRLASNSPASFQRSSFMKLNVGGVEKKTSGNRD